MRRGGIAAVFAALCVLVALRGGVDADERAFIISMGVDAAEGGGVTVTLVMPSAQPGGAAAEGGEKSAYELVRATAATYEDALLVLRTTIPRFISFSQLLQVVVSEKLARSADFPALLESIVRTPRLKQSAVLAVSLSSAAAFLEKQQPFLGIRLSANIETSFAVYAALGNVPVTPVGGAVRLLSDAWRTPLLPLVALNHTAHDQPALSGNPLGTVAGNLPYEGNGPTEYLGAAVIAQGRMAGTLTGAEMELISLIRGDVDEITFSRNGVVCRLKRQGRPALRVRCDGGQWVLSVTGQIQSGGAPEASTEQLESSVAGEVLSVLAKLQALGADPLGFAGRAAARFPTLEAWRAADWPQAYSQARLEVSLAVNAAEGVA